MELKTITAAEISEKDLGEIKFVVDKLLPVGLNLLAGSPKVGKSWFSLWLAIKVGKGEQLFNFQTDAGTVLYMALEDNEIRLQNRVLDITENAPNNVHFCTEISRLGGELENHIQQFVTSNVDTKLVIIDTLQMVRPLKSDSTYTNDYTDLIDIKNLAYKLQISILLIHHFRKQKDSDIFNQITGSTGLQGVVDNMFTLHLKQRGDDIIILNCVGRDIEEREIHLSRTNENDWVKVTDNLSDKDLEEHSFLKAIENIVAVNKNFTGTATELSTLIEEKSAIKISPKTITRKLKQLHSKLAKLDVECIYRRSNGIRIIQLFMKSADSDVKTPP